MATTTQIQDLIELQSGNTPISTLKLLCQDDGTNIKTSFATNGPQYNLNDAMKIVGVTEDPVVIAYQIEEYQEQQRKRRVEAYNNRPILPFSGTDSYEVYSNVREYGGTNGNPVTEGFQTIVTVEVYNDDHGRSCNMNFYNKDELDKFILELQVARGRFQ